MGASGPNPISRAAAPNPQLPYMQGWISPASDQPAPFGHPMPGPLIGVIGPRTTWIGYQWAPGQGGDTPGGGGAATAGQTIAVQTQWFKNGLVIPMSQQPHVSGTVGWVGTRRSRA